MWWLKILYICLILDLYLSFAKMLGSKVCLVLCTLTDRLTLKGAVVAIGFKFGRVLNKVAE